MPNWITDVGESYRYKGFIAGLRAAFYLVDNDEETPAKVLIREHIEKELARKPLRFTSGGARCPMCGSELSSLFQPNPCPLGCIP